MVGLWTVRQMFIIGSVEQLSKSSKSQLFQGGLSTWRQWFLRFFSPIVTIALRSLVPEHWVTIFFLGLLRWMTSIRLHLMETSGWFWKRILEHTGREWSCEADSCFFCVKGKEVLYLGKSRSCCPIIVHMSLHMWRANSGFLVSICSSFSLSSTGEVTFGAWRIAVHECLPTSVPGCRRPWADSFKGGWRTNVWDLGSLKLQCPEFKPFCWEIFLGVNRVTGLPVKL